LAPEAFSKPRFSGLEDFQKAVFPVRKLFKIDVLIWNPSKKW
jgi:hypothetical protein